MEEISAGIGLDPVKFGTHSLRCTKVVLVYRRTGNLRAALIFLGHSKIKGTVRDLGIEVDDAIEIAEKIDICACDAIQLRPDMVGGGYRIADYTVPMPAIGIDRCGGEPASSRARHCLRSQ